MSWKDTLLPEFHCEEEMSKEMRREMLKKFNGAKKDDMRAIAWLMHIQTSPGTAAGIRRDATRALYVVDMLRHLKMVTESEIQKTLLATLDTEKERAVAALYERAECRNRKLADSAKAALNFLTFKRKYGEV